MGDEGGLHGMQLVAARDTLDGEDVGAVVADRQSQARIDPPAVDQYRASAALAAVASLLGAGQMETLAQQIKQRDARVRKRDVPSRAIHGKADGEVHAVLRSMLWSNIDCRRRRGSAGMSRLDTRTHIRRHPPFSRERTTTI